MRAARSPEVAAEKAPPVMASNGCGLGALAGAGVVSGASDILLREKSGNMDFLETGAPTHPARVWLVKGERAKGIFAGI
jgi:hypothetical protein